MLRLSTCRDLISWLRYRNRSNNGFESTRSVSGSPTRSRTFRHRNKGTFCECPEDYDERIEQIVSPEDTTSRIELHRLFSKEHAGVLGQLGCGKDAAQRKRCGRSAGRRKILSSTGEELAVEFTVTDATGLEWFSRNYRELASKYGYEAGLPPGVDAFQGLYTRFADDLLAYRKS